MGAKREIPTPEGEARMSAVILEVAEPLLRKYAQTPERAKTVIMLTVAGWNKSLFPPDKRSVVEKEIIDHLVPEDGSGEAIGVAVQIMDTAAGRREKLFPDLRKVIVDYEVEISGDSLNLNVSSAPVPDLER
ncbi:MAG: hypothetical protein HQ567_25765 [Candidatus Nealsonbacteria bacterium]|nr:hypothetical protein [Candidatus Nealsonbacteria bacterium]